MQINNLNLQMVKIRQPWTDYPLK